MKAHTKLFTVSSTSRPRKSKKQRIEKRRMERRKRQTRIRERGARLHPPFLLFFFFAAYAKRAKNYPMKAKEKERERHTKDKTRFM